MEDRNTNAGRRKFLKQSVQALATIPAVAAAMPAAEQTPPDTERDSQEALPGDPGYRDPGAYGSLGQ